MLSIPLARIGSLEMHESLSRRDDLGCMQVIGEGKILPRCAAAWHNQHNTHVC